MIALYCDSLNYELQKQLNDAVELLDKFERQEQLPGVSDQQLWKAQKIKQVSEEFGCNTSIYCKKEYNTYQSA